MKALERARRAAASVWFRATLSNRPSVYEQSLPGLGGFRFAVIRKRRRARSEQLTGHVISSPRLWKFLNQADDRGRVIKQSIFKIENSVFNSLCLFLVRRGVIGSMFDVRCFPYSSGSIFDVGCFLCPSENCSFSAILIRG